MYTENEHKDLCIYLKCQNFYSSKYDMLFFSQRHIKESRFEAPHEMMQ